MAAVLAIVWKWFDRDPRARWFDPAALQAVPRHSTGLLPGAAWVLAVAAVFPAWSVAIGGRAQPLPDQIDLPEIPGWHRAPLATNAPWTPSYPGTDHFLVGRYTDGADQIDIALAVYADQHAGKELVSFGTGVLREIGRAHV